MLKNQKNLNNNVKKLSYKESERLELLPVEISDLEKKIEALENIISDKDYYKKDKEDFKECLENKYSEWSDLEEYS